MKNIVFLYPADYFNPKTQADDMFDIELEVALSNLCGAALFDFDTGDITKTAINDDFTPDNNIVIYRGWQVSPEKYQQVIYPLMEKFGTPLISPIEYTTMHMFDGYEAYVKDYLLPSYRLTYDEVMTSDEWFDKLAALGFKFFVKDDIKSVYDNRKIYLGRKDELDLFRKQLQQLADERGNDFSGAFVFKPWVEISEQARFFVYNGQVILGTPHDGEWSGYYPDNIPTDLPSPFYTVDMAYNSKDCYWFVVECGDGQVSEIGTTVGIETVYHALMEQQ